MKRQTRKVGVAGGFFNQLMGNNSTVPVVGEGATILMYSDRNAYDVTWVSEDGNECKIRPCKCKYVGSGYGDERYEYEPDPEGYEVLLRWNARSNKWQTVYNEIKPIKSKFNALLKKHGWSWHEHFVDEFGVSLKEVEKDENDPTYNPCDAYIQYKLVEGVTKKYERKSDVSIIFGTRQQYRDPSF